MKFYRYETREYASLDMDGEYEPSPYPNPKLEVTEFSLHRETPKGYWIGYGDYVRKHLRGSSHWVSKTSKKRYAYPTKTEALVNYIKRTERRVKIMKRQTWSCSIGIDLAKAELNKQNL